MSEPTPDHAPYYITTPIYYVNDRPHIGHCYTTLVADVAARAQRLMGRDVFFLTGTDEHAEKVVTTAKEKGRTPMEWATINAERFKAAFAFMNFSHDDFVRTTEDRHKTRASGYIQRLVDSGDIELGDYEGWWDGSQEEYVTENTAKEHDYKSPVTGKPLEKRVEQNYFFRLDRYEGWLKERIESGAVRVLPEARRNEVLGRIKTGLNRVPVSRKIKPDDPDWGVVMPNDPEHRVYVWIEALCNYLTMVDQPDRRKYWREPVHLMAKDILWFHAVIWPCMIEALHRAGMWQDEGVELTPPATVYAHAYWIAEGRKMSKSLGNFIEIDTLKAYAEKYSLDAVRWFLATQGPLGANDADFAHARFVDVYNSDLANSFGNSASRVGNMVGKYFDGVVPKTCDGRFGFEGGRALQAALAARAATGKPAQGEPRTFDLAALTAGAVERFGHALEAVDLEAALGEGLGIVRAVDEFITYSAPFTLAKKFGEIEHAEGALGAILYSCAEALRIASLLLSPAMPEKTAVLWRDWNCGHLKDPADPNSGFVAPLSELAAWGGAHSIKAGQGIAKGGALFMRADATEPAPG